MAPSAADHQHSDVDVGWIQANAVGRRIMRKRHCDHRKPNQLTWLNVALSPRCVSAGFTLLASLLLARTHNPLQNNGRRRVPASQAVLRRPRWPGGQAARALLHVEMVPELGMRGKIYCDAVAYSYEGYFFPPNFFFFVEELRHATATGTS